MKLKKERFIGSMQLMESKYKRLYGEGNYREKIQKQQKAMTTRYLLVLGVFSFVLLYSLVNDFRTMPEVVKDEQQRITAVQRPKEEALPLVLDAKVWAVNEELKVSKEAQLVIDAQNKEGQREEPVRSETESQKLERKIGSAIRSLNQDTKTEKVILPKALADGTKLIWQEKKQGNYPMVILGGMLTLFVIYKSRFDGIKKEEGRARESVIKELPEFLNKLVLLLSSGMVLQGAFERIMEDYGRMEGGKPSYFYGQLHEVYVKTKETNAIFQEEFRSFARRSQVRELMRLSNIITDNIHKGADLSGKLQRESESLWFNRKKYAEEKGRLAETKLTLPLVILLLVLVMITIAPAMMEM